jgi:hypothetical protein
MRLGQRLTREATFPSRPILIALIAKERHHLHQKRRKWAVRLRALKADHAAGKVGMCFGSRKLFRAQFDWAAKGYASLED